MPPPGKDRARTNKPGDAKGRVRRGKPKVCLFCAEHITWVDYKDTNVLRRFMTDRGKIKSRSSAGTCAQHQRDVALAIKTARELAMLPYVVRTLAADKAGGRRGRGPGRPGGPGRPPGAEGLGSGAGGEADAASNEDGAGGVNVDAALV